jgi:hypothetical protein
MSKNKITLSVLAFVTLGILSACTTADTGNETYVTPVKTENTTTSSTEQVKTPPVIVSADEAAYDSAIHLVDVTFCKKISDSSLMASCERDVSTLTGFKEAFSKKDTSKCAQIIDPNQRQSCETQIAAALKADQQKSDLAAQGADDVKKSAEILQSGDYTQCAQLTLDSSKKDCEVNVLVRKAQETSDASWCSKATIAEAKELCLTTINELQAQNQ